MKNIVYILMTALLISACGDSNSNKPEQANTQAQISKDNYSLIVTEVMGDLNKDNLEDKVIVSQDTINQNSPYRLQIFFAQPKGEFKLFVTSTKIIQAQYPDGRDALQSGTEFSDITIENGILNINVELLRGHFEHKFRFQNGNFELIGFSKVESDGGGVMKTIDFNLSTGIRTEKSERYDTETDSVLSNTKKKIPISPLPKLQDVEPFVNELY